MNSETEWSGQYFLMRKGYERLPDGHDMDLLAGEVYFNHWSRQRHPYKTLAEGDTVYLLDLDSEPRSLAVELRVSSMLASPYDSLHEGMKQLRTAFGMVQPEEGWPGYSPSPGRGYLLAYNVDVIAPMNIPFDFRWDLLGGHNGYISVATFAASDRIDAKARDSVLNQLPTPGRPPLARSGPADTRGVLREDLLGRAPRHPSLAVKKMVNARSGRVCEHSGCTRTAEHFDHKVPWSKGGNSDLVNIQHLCGRCNLAKSDRMPDSFRPEQMWISFISCDLGGNSITLGADATAAEVRTRNSIYDVVYDDNRMLVWKRGQREVWCGAIRHDQGVLKLPSGRKILGCGVDRKGKRINDGAYMRTSPIEDFRAVCVDRTLARLGKSVGAELQFTHRS